MHVENELHALDITNKSIEYTLNLLSELDNNTHTNNCYCKLIEAKHWLLEYKNHLNSFLQGSN